MVRQGTLELHLISANDLRNVELIGRQDPYCVIKCDGASRNDRQARSKTHQDGGKNPTWNQTFIFNNVTENSTLNIDIFDENMIRRDVLIGTCKIKLAQVVERGIDDIQAEVMTQRHRPQGFLKLGLRFKEGSHEVSSGPQSGRIAKGANPMWITDCQLDVNQDYALGAVLGRGTFGITRKAVHRRTAKEFACKSISKRKLNTEEEREDVRREIQIMHHLSGHVNVVNIQSVYEDKKDVHIVMELCTGGELFDRIVDKGSYSERDAADVIRTIVGVVAHCHNMGVIHRDLKPENFLLADRSPSATLKATDFGLSVFFKEDDQLVDIVGSAYYVAPEVLRRNYGKEADIWSCGVILYILLSGVPPFYGDNERQIFESILKDPLDFESQPWPSITDAAKDCVRRMLARDPKKRASASDILKHDWMRENGVASDKPIEMEVLKRIKNFSAANRLKKEALLVIAKNLPLEEIAGLDALFKEIDHDNSGSITIDEFRLALKKKGALLQESDLQRLMEEADVNGDGTLDYQEFLAATMNMGKLNQGENLRKAFEHFDSDGNGRISREELRKALQDIGMSNIEEIIAEVDIDGNGEIDYQEFCAMMRDL